VKKYKLYLHTSSKKTANDSLLSLTIGRLVSKGTDGSLLIENSMAEASEILSAPDLELSLLNKLTMNIASPDNTLEIITDNCILFDCISKELWKKWAFSKWLNSNGNPINARYDWERFAKNCKIIHKYTVIKPKKLDIMMSEITDLCKDKLMQLYRTTLI